MKFSQLDTIYLAKKSEVSKIQLSKTKIQIRNMGETNMRNTMSTILCPRCGSIVPLALVHSGTCPNCPKSMQRDPPLPPLPPLTTPLHPLPLVVVDPVTGEYAPPVAPPSRLKRKSQKSSIWKRLMIWTTIAWPVLATLLAVFIVVSTYATSTHYHGYWMLDDGFTVVKEGHMAGVAIGSGLLLAAGTTCPYAACILVLAVLDFATKSERR